jgi:hypothetical protein
MWSQIIFRSKKKISNVILDAYYGALFSSSLVSKGTMNNLYHRLTITVMPWYSTSWALFHQFWVLPYIFYQNTPKVKASMLN